MSIKTASPSKARCPPQPYHTSVYIIYLAKMTCCFYFVTRKVTIDLTKFSESPIGVPPSTSGSLIKVSGRVFLSLEQEYHNLHAETLKGTWYMYLLNNGTTIIMCGYCILVCLYVTMIVDVLSISIMQCSYVIDVAVHVPWAPDIEVRQPLLIKPPPNVIVSQFTIA